MSLDERAATFNSQFDDVKLSASRLFSIYKGLGISRKVIVKDVILKQRHGVRIRKHLETVKKEMLDAPGGLSEIVYVDECVFTYSTELKLAFSNPHENIIADKKQMSMTSMAAVAAISA